VVLRNAAARRSELAILRALGMPSRQIFLYLMSEYAYWLVGGMTAGILPALVAVRPAMRSLGQPMPIGLVTILILGMLAAGVAGIFAAVLAASRMRTVEALRGE